MSSPRPSARHLAVYLLFLCGCATLSSLGLWQLHRAQEKRARFELFTTRFTAPAVELDALARDTPIADYRWRRTHMRGRYHDLHLVLDNRILDGRPGYEILTVFETVGGRMLLVNRGWIPLPDSRDVAPDVLAPSDPISLTGHIGAEPVSGIVLDARSREAEIMSPQIYRVQRIDLDGVGALVGIDLWPAIIYLDAGQPGALTVRWPEPGDGSARHTAYAVQWFAMAVVLAGIGVWNLKRGRRIES